MSSRIMWILVAGLALVAGMAVQDGDRIFSWGEDAEISSRAESRVERAVDRGVAQIPVVDARGRDADISHEAKRALAEAVGRLVEAEADYALMRVRDARPEQVAAAKAARDHARADVDRLKADIKSHQQAARKQRDAARDELRDDIRQTVRDAVGN